MKKAKKQGMEIDTVIGDTAYSEKENIHYAKENKLQLVSKLNPVITDGTRPKKKEFEFDKDTNLFICPAGHLATRKARTGKKNQVLTYFLILKSVKFVLFKRDVIKKERRV